MGYRVTGAANGPNVGGRRAPDCADDAAKPGRHLNGFAVSEVVDPAAVATDPGAAVVRDPEAPGYRRSGWSKVGESAGATFPDPDQDFITGFGEPGLDDCGAISYSSNEP